MRKYTLAMVFNGSGEFVCEYWYMRGYKIIGAWHVKLKEPIAPYIPYALAQ